jgi:hypothetical protein
LGRVITLEMGKQVLRFVHLFLDSFLLTILFLGVLPRRPCVHLIVHLIVDSLLTLNIMASRKPLSHVS